MCIYIHIYIYIITIYPSQEEKRGHFPLISHKKRAYWQKKKVKEEGI